MMPAESFTVSPQTLNDFSDKLSAWAASLDATMQAMLMDLLAKAGGDVYGNTAANEDASPSGKSQDAGDLSPLELGDFKNTIQGIFKIGPKGGSR
jgi:hypothetical protein